MPRRIILHAGFHLTGAAVIQATLRANRVALKKHAALRLRWHMQDLLSATCGYATTRDPLTLTKVQDRFKALMNDLPGMPRRSLIISAQELAGSLPGCGGQEDYSASPVLLYALWEIISKRYPAAETLIYLSTRAPDAWLRSAHWEHVRTSSMTMDFKAFYTRYQAAADFDGVVSDIASRVPCPVHHTALEDCRDLPLGPADPLLDLCDLPLALRAELVAQPAIERHPDDDVLAALIKANKANQTPETRKAAKAAILAEAQIS